MAMISVSDITPLNHNFVKAACTHLRPLPFLCSTEKLKICFVFRCSPTAEATEHSHILNPTYWSQNVLAAPLEDSNLCLWLTKQAK